MGIRHPAEHMKNRRGELALLQRFDDEFGLCSAWQGVHPDAALPQTLRWARDPDPPYHCDGIFLPRSWLTALTSVEILADEAWVALSDHNPILAAGIVKTAVLSERLDA